MYVKILSHIIIKKKDKSFFGSHKFKVGFGPNASGSVTFFFLGLSFIPSLHNKYTDFQHCVCVYIYIYIYIFYHGFKIKKISMHNSKTNIKPIIRQ